MKNDIETAREFRASYTNNSASNFDIDDLLVAYASTLRPAQIGDEEIEKEIRRLVPVLSDTAMDGCMMPRWQVRYKMKEIIKWYRSALAGKEEMG